jgi:Ser/Thr protein kinase RdoA (MazF antagonist)
MRGFLGEKTGEGASADIHVWAPGQVVKLFKVGASPRFGRHEARMTRAASAAGAPEVFGEVILEGRFGIVLQRLDGPTLLQLWQARAVTSEQVGAIPATLYASVHKTPPPPDVPPLRGWVDAVSQTSRDILPEHIATGVLTLIDGLPPEHGLCHADLHPGNVIMTADGPRLVDWGSATRAPAGLDLACCHVINSELAPETVDDPERPRANDAAMRSEYARLAGMSPAALTAAVEPYLPILRAFALAEVATNPARRARLIQRVEATLRSED